MSPWSLVGDVEDVGVSGATAIDPELSAYRRGLLVLDAYRRYCSRQEMRPAPRFRVRLDDVNLVAQIGRQARSKEDAAALFGIPEGAFARPQARGAFAEWRRTYARARARQRRARDLRIRLVAAAKERQQWACVFSTLTVRPGALGDVFGRGSTAFKEHVRRVQRLVSPDPANAVYCGVVERGGKGGRLHIHVLWWIKDLPEAWLSDPSRFEGDTRRELVGVERGTLWPYGFSTFIAIRFHRSDYFGKRGWRWPWRVCPEGKEPVPDGKPEMMAAYLTKYLVKDQGKTHGGNKQWRVRMTRGLGLEKIQRSLERNPEVLPLLLVNPEPCLRRMKPHERPSKSVLKRSAWLLLRKTLDPDSRRALTEWLVTTGGQRRPSSKPTPSRTPSSYIRASYGRVRHLLEGSRGPGNVENAQKAISDWFERQMFEKSRLFDGWYLTFTEEVLL